MTGFIQRLTKAFSGAQEPTRTETRADGAVVTYKGSEIVGISYKTQMEQDATNKALAAVLKAQSTSGV